MIEKRFERIYADVDVFCRDHNAKGASQLIEREDYDKIVDLLNEQHEQIERLKGNFRALDEVKCELAEENEQLKQFKEKIFTSIEKEIARNEKTIEWKKETLDLLNEFYEINKKLHDENEELKKENEFLKRICNEDYRNLRRAYRMATKKR